MTADRYIEVAQQAIQAKDVVILIVVGVIGLAMNYAGFRLYRYFLFGAGAFIGGVIPAMGVAAAGDTGSALLVGLVGGIIGGFLAVFLTYLGVFLLGALVGALIGAVIAPDPIVILIASVICGSMAMGLFNIAIVISTSFTGSLKLTFVTINVMALAQTGKTSWMSGKFLDYVASIIKSMFQTGGNLESAYQMAGSHLVIFGFFFLTGLVFQINYGGFARMIRENEQDARRAMKESSIPRKRATSPIVAKALPQARPPRWKASLYYGGELLHSLDLKVGRILIGREDGVHVQISDPAMSRKHLYVEVSRDGKLTIEDAGSTSGVLKQGKERVVRESPEASDWYLLGDTQVVFHQESA